MKRGRMGISGALAGAVNGLFGGGGGMVLSPLLEENMRKAFIISQGSVSIFFNSPIACVLMIILGVFIAFPIVKFIKKKLAKQ